MSRSNHSLIILDLKNNILKHPDIEVIRVENSFKVGMPDVLLLIPNKTIYVEIKQKYDYLSKSQMNWWKRALDLKQPCFILKYTWRLETKKFSYLLYRPTSPAKSAWGVPLCLRSTEFIDVFLNV